MTCTGTGIIGSQFDYRADNMALYLYPNMETNKLTDDLEYRLGLEEFEQE